MQGMKSRMCRSPLRQPAGLDQRDKEGRFWQEKEGDSAHRAMMGGTVQDSFNVWSRAWMAGGATCQDA